MRINIISNRLIAGFALSFLLFAWCVFPYAASAAAADPRFDTTFIQFTADNATWPQSRWETLLDGLRQTGVNRLVVQWTVLGDTSFFKRVTKRGPSFDVLETVADAAQARGMTLILGLDCDSRWWERIATVPESLSAYLETLLARRLETAQALSAMFAGRPCLQGWYVSEEIDDVNWLEESKRAPLASYLKRLRSGLEKLDPGRRTWISSFANGKMSPGAFHDFLAALLSKSGIDGLLFQDGVGAGKLKPSEARLYMESACLAARESKAAFMPIVEIFEQTSGPPIDDKPFQARPAPLVRVLAQLKLAGDFGQDGIAAFSMPEYASPVAGPEALTLYLQYRKYLDGALKKGN